MPVQEWFCKMCMTTVYCPCSEFESTFNAYWHGEGAARLSCTELSIWEFPFLRGGCRQWGNNIWYCVNGMPQKDTLENVRTPVCFRILSSSLTSVSIFSVWCYSSVSISVLTSACIPPWTPVWWGPPGCDGPGRGRGLPPAPGVSVPPPAARYHHSCTGLDNRYTVYTDSECVAVQGAEEGCRSLQGCRHSLRQPVTIIAVLALETET